MEPAPHPGRGTAAGTPSTSLAEVVRVLDAIEAAGCRVRVEGGWGVDALVGGQTRPHPDLDVDIDAAQEAAVLTAIQQIEWHAGYELMATDHADLARLRALGSGRRPDA